jgi:hypothetical protein
VSAASTRQGFGRAALVTLVLSISALLVLPATAFGQTTGTPTVAPTASATTVPVLALTLSTQSGLAGALITANGSGFKPTETVDVSFNGASVGSPVVNSGGTFSSELNGA